MPTTRIYEVKATVTTKPLVAGKGHETCTEEHVYLVEASGRSTAERHVAEKYVSKAEVASPKRIVELMGQGKKVETAKVED